jgi:hypothetical protein
MGESQIRSLVPTPHEILLGDVVLSIESELSVDARSAESNVRVFDRAGDFVPGTVKVIRGGRRLEWRPEQPVAPGTFRVAVEELATPEGQRIDGKLDVPFVVASSAAKVPNRLAIRSLQRAAVRPRGLVPLTPADRPRGRIIQYVKAVDRRSGDTVTLAFDRDGKKVDADSVERSVLEKQARQGKIHGGLQARIGKARKGEQIPVAVWLTVPDAEDDANDRRPERLDEIDDARRARGGEPIKAVRTEQVATAVSRFMEMAERELSGAEARSDRLAPVVYASLSAAQIRALAKRDDVAAVFPYDPRGVDDLTQSVAISEAAVPQANGITGNGVRVAVWELGPDQTNQLNIQGFFDPGQSAMSGHARMTCGIISNTASSGSNGYAPDCDLFSANSRDLGALAWAVGEGCTVISQSFHRPDEQTESGLSFDDVYKDWLVLRRPWPTIIQASGNGPSSEFVNHKGFNSLAIGSHDDTAGAMAGSSVFTNPASGHGDRELPELCANGTGVTVLGLTDSGTSFAAPAVAGTAALIQSADSVLESWPEATRAILLAGARRNVTGSRWWSDVSAGVDAKDGSGALNARESVEIANQRGRRGGSGSRRGWDIGRVRSSDFGSDGFLNWDYRLAVPQQQGPLQIFTTWRAKAVLAWNSRVSEFNFFGIQFPFGSSLTLDLDLEVYDSGGNLVTGSWSWDNSYEIAEWTAVPGETYTIRPRRWSGSDASWFGIAWTAVPVFLRPPIDPDSVIAQTLSEASASG